MARSLQEANEELGTKHALIRDVFKEARSGGGEDLDCELVKAFGEGLTTQAKVDKFREGKGEMAELTVEGKNMECGGGGECARGP